MPDQLRERFDALRRAADQSDAGGLHDVRLRRTRRARAQIGVATAASVATLALAGVVVLPQLGSDSASTAGGAQVLNDADGARGSEPITAEDEAAVGQAPTAVPTEEATTSAAPPEDVTPHGPFVVSTDSLLTWEDIQAVGESGPGTTPYGATLVFPALCGAGNAWEQYSGPDEVVAKAWVISDGVLTQSDLQYESDQQATDALARLSADAQACPVVNEYASIEYLGIDSSAGAEIAFFEMRVESGEDGSISVSSITVTRVANVLVEVVLRPDGPAVANAVDRSRALARAAVDRVLATG